MEATKIAEALIAAALIEDQIVAEDSVVKLIVVDHIVINLTQVDQFIRPLFLYLLILGVKPTLTGILLQLIQPPGEPQLKGNRAAGKFQLTGETQLKAPRPLLRALLIKRHQVLDHRSKTVNLLLRKALKKQLLTTIQLKVIVIPTLTQSSIQNLLVLKTFKP